MTNWPGPGVGKVLITEEQLAARVVELGEQITADYAGQEPLLVTVLKGGFVFVADLARRIDLPVELDFMAVSSYGDGTKSSGVVQIVKDLDADITGRHVIVVEDIVDTGLTLEYLIRTLEAREPASLDVCTLLLRELADSTPIFEPKYVGFTLPPVFVIGYGLDVAGRYRNLGYIAEYTP